MYDVLEYHRRSVNMPREWWKLSMLIERADALSGCVDEPLNEPAAVRCGLK